MAIDWKKEIDLTKRIWLWYMKAALITVPFGFLYALTVFHLGHDSKTALVIVLITAMLVTFRIIGMPPNE
jgi:hypothetical protein